MKLKSIYSIQISDRLAKPIYNDNGQRLLNSGIALSESMISRLKEKGISYLYIEDDLTSDIYVTDVISEQTKAKSLKTISDNFTSISDRIKTGKSVNLHELTPSFSNIIDSILQEISGNEEAISMLANVVSFDSYVFHHSLNVTVYTIALGRKLGLNEKELKDLGLGAILHDVGKMGIPVDILNKTDKLTEEEYETIQNHAELGFEMIRKSGDLSLLTAHCAFQHHERLDGSGYPRQLSSKDIHYYARIIGVADVYDAMTSNRVYRKAFLPHEALELLYSGADILYDKKIIEVFSKTIAIYPIGLEVTLSDGRQGIIINNNTELPSRPIIRVEFDGEGNGSYDIDLSEELNVTISSCDSLTQETKI
ncbi:hypothetical protein CR203_20590 [Salipaludibacillus neizhouensis]|uniref:HD-GYP domain-containing protein n=1 Tax=Salipaludibacillus neizhouensis TaxID=885475 RepID=A0A3A9JYB3_9BACI|nr:HD-GYP domain-containing protein [Salipaludibacillus neizhouensis]RKL65477.1 hypothetical protein CR203_20590 [Salipaludibacillus neizhouensis]